MPQNTAMHLHTIESILIPPIQPQVQLPLLLCISRGGLDTPELPVEPPDYKTGHLKFLTVNYQKCAVINCALVHVCNIHTCTCMVLISKFSQYLVKTANLRWFYWKLLSTGVSTSCTLFKPGFHMCLRHVWTCPRQCLLHCVTCLRHLRKPGLLLCDWYLWPMSGTCLRQCLLHSTLLCGMSQALKETIILLCDFCVLIIFYICDPVRHLSQKIINCIHYFAIFERTFDS